LSEKKVSVFLQHLCSPLSFRFFFSFEYIYLVFIKDPPFFMTFPPPGAEGGPEEDGRSFKLQILVPNTPYKSLLGREVSVSRVPFGTSEIFSPTAPEESNFMFPKKKSILSSPFPTVPPPPGESPPEKEARRPTPPHREEEPLEGATLRDPPFPKKEGCVTKLLRNAPGGGKIPLFRRAGAEN
jgi:hypothetical protein